MAAQLAVRTVVECKSCTSVAPDHKYFFTPRWLIELNLDCGHMLTLRLGLLPGLVRKNPTDLTLWKGEKVACHACPKKEV